MHVCALLVFAVILELDFLGRLGAQRVGVGAPRLILCVLCIDEMGLFARQQYKRVAFGAGS